MKLPHSDTFWDGCIPEPNTGCWLWLGFISPDGYGTRLAHRRAWELARGPIPDGMLVCHRCDVRHCVNPDHLFLGTHLDNMRDMIRKGRGGWTPAKPSPEPDPTIPKHPGGRPSTGASETRLNLPLPSALLGLATEAARLEGVTRAEFIRRAIRARLTYTLAEKMEHALNP